MGRRLWRFGCDTYLTTGTSTLDSWYWSMLEGQCRQGMLGYNILVDFFGDLITLTWGIMEFGERGVRCRIGIGLYGLFCHSMYVLRDTRTG